MNLGTAERKKDLLYLMRISAKVDVKACASVIQITYRLPVLQNNDYTPWRAILVPKNVKGKALVLTHMPFLITWREQVYEFSETEYRDCTLRTNICFAVHRQKYRTFWEIVYTAWLKTFPGQH